MTRRKPFLAAALIFAAGFVFTAQAQVTCSYGATNPPVIRLQGFTEPVADIVLQCTGGVSTPANGIVPTVNITLTINTNLTSRVTQDAPTIDFSEALLLIDEPNSPAPVGIAALPSTPLLNCGHNGAPDDGAVGPGVCETVSDGNPLDSYNGQINVMGATPCDGMGTDPKPNTFGCGRPNAFGGRLVPAASAVLENVVEFMGVPFDPPGAIGTITLRITNIRANAVALNSSTPTPVTALVTINGDFAISVPPGDVIVATPFNGMTASIPTAGTVRVTEGYSTAFRDRNISFTLANATFTGGEYQYNGGLNYPAEAAQNVPGVVYSGAEDLFQWQNNGANAPPSPNPPAGLGAPPVTNLDYPLDSSMMFGGVNTDINTDGVTTQGTRVALHFLAFPGVTITVPPIVYLHTVTAPAVNSGVMVLTGTDLDGAGPYTPLFTPAAAPVPAAVKNGLAVYEILYADPAAVEFADIPVTTAGFLHEFTVVSASFAPFYLQALTPGAAQATPTAAHATPTATPRFDLTGALMFLY
jgi:hypothetical protein